QRPPIPARRSADLESGKPVVVPQASNEPLFLGRADQTKKLSRQEITFICVPITLNRKSVGALAGVLRYKKDRDYDRAVKFLKVVASIIAQGLKVHQMVELEKQRLLDENIHLRQELKQRYDFSNI